MSAIATSAPARARVSASARPSPREPPVTSATRPERSISSGTARSYAARTVPVQRMDVAERRARLVQRHRLSPQRRAGDPLEAARSVVVLHSTDAVTVFLSVHARTSNVLPADIERELYETRSLVRILGMRRTLFVVPRELVPVVYAACTRTIAARERRRLEKMIVDSGISTRPAAWLTRASKAALRALEARGEAFTSELTKDVTDPREAPALRRGLEVRSHPERRLAPAPAAGDGASARPRPSPRNLGQRAVPVGADGELARRRSPGDGKCGGAGGASSTLAGGVRAGDRDRHPLVDWLDGA